MNKQAKSAVSLAVTTLVSTFSHAAMVAECVALENASTAQQTLSAILALRKTLSGAEYMSACVDIFGTSGVHHSKPEYRPGALRATLEKEGGKDACDRIKFRLGQARAVAVWLADPVNYAKATTKDEDGNLPALETLDKARRAEKPVTTRAPRVTKGNVASDAAAPSAVTTGSAQTDLDALVTRYGFAAMCNAFADAINATKGAKITAESVRALAKVA